MDPISSTQLWAGVGAICATLVMAISVLYKTQSAAQERREKSLEERAKEDRDKCAAAYESVAGRLREMEDRAHKEAVTWNREIISALKESIDTNREMSRCAGELTKASAETVKAGGRIANLVTLFCEHNGISITKQAPAARNDESSQHFAMPDPVEKFTTARPGKAV